MGQSLENVPGRKCLSEQPSAEYENFSENGQYPRYFLHMEKMRQRQTVL